MRKLPREILREKKNINVQNTQVKQQANVSKIFNFNF